MLQLLRVPHMFAVHLEYHLACPQETLTSRRAAAEDPGDDHVTWLVDLHRQPLKEIRTHENKRLAFG